MKADPWIVEELQRIDPRLEVQFLTCRRSAGDNHDNCPRIAFSRKRACNRWVLYRRILDGGADGASIERFFGKQWKGPMPSKVLVFVWENPRSKACSHVCDLKIEDHCCWCAGRKEFCDICIMGQTEGFRPLDNRLIRHLRENDTYKMFVNEVTIRNLIEKQLELQIRIEERQFREFSQRSKEQFVRAMKDGDIHGLLNMPEAEAAKRLREGNIGPSRSYG